MFPIQLGATANDNHIHFMNGFKRHLTTLGPILLENLTSILRSLSSITNLPVGVDKENRSIINKSTRLRNVTDCQRFLTFRFCCLTPRKPRPLGCIKTSFISSLRVRGNSNSTISLMVLLFCLKQCFQLFQDNNQPLRGIISASG